MNYRLIFHTLGWVISFEGICMLLPFACALGFLEQNPFIFLICMGICLLVGIPLTLIRPKEKSMFAKEGFVIVALSWIFLSIFGALPFFLSREIPLFSDALFETASGFSTTGASILPNVEALSKSMLFWRSFTHWIGGMGVIVFLVALLPLSGGDNMHLLRAESPGHSVGKLVPHVKSTAKILYSIYIGLTVLQFALMMADPGMDWFTALTLTFGTAGTGGFAILNSGLATYSPYIQWVVTVFMFIFGVDFTFYYCILMRRYKTAFSMEEVRTYVGIVLVMTALICLNIFHMIGNTADTLRHSAFQVASIITTTGYSTMDFNLWPQFSQMILVGLMFVGACAGSTGGGMKVSRVLVLCKSVLKEIRVLTHPKCTTRVKLNGRPIEHETLRGITVFFISYIFIFAIALLIISFDNFDFTTNFTAVAATLSNIGPGLCGVGPTANFSGYSPLSTMVLTLVMIAGRLEIFPMLVLFSRKTWKR
ncbi:MAG: TrkH family potassium uptake protein [Clostridia bacterium]|nr:TrkH family potassium uptake protein [Clostridia bacterium]